MTRSPLLTVGIPLHRSRAFVDVVSANIAAADRADVEFLVSDRTGHDDALAVLAARHAGDPRVVARRALDGAGWVDHCNALLRAARGVYFCWMPHDDSFPRGWVDALLGCLETDPDALMAFGRIEPVLADGTPAAVDRCQHPAPGTGSGTWSVHDAVAALRRWRGGYGFAGMFRRAPVVAGGLFLPHTRDDMAADVAWVFGMALLGRLRYVPQAAYRKRYYARSAHRSWRYRPAHHLSLGWALARHAVRYSESPGAAIVALAAAAEMTAKRLASGPGRRGARVEEGLRRFAGLAPRRGGRLPAPPGGVGARRAPAWSPDDAR